MSKQGTKAEKQPSLEQFDRAIKRARAAKAKAKPESDLYVKARKAKDKAGMDATARGAEPMNVPRRSGANCASSARASTPRRRSSDRNAWRAKRGRPSAALFGVTPRRPISELPDCQRGGSGEDRTGEGGKAMRKAIAVLAAGLMLALAVAGSGSSSAQGWRVVKSKSVSGQFAVTGTSATINHPRGIAVRYRGSGVHGMAVWGCSQGMSVASWSRRYGAGLHVLGHVRGKESCDVTASISGQGRITVQILKWR